MNEESLCAHAAHGLMTTATLTIANVTSNLSTTIHYNTLLCERWSRISGIQRISSSLSFASFSINCFLALFALLYVSPCLRMDQTLLLSVSYLWQKNSSRDSGIQCRASNQLNLTYFTNQTHYKTVNSSSLLFTVINKGKFVLILS